jgi:glycosyltransferase involved in cell wall biosynthesis
VTAHPSAVRAETIHGAVIIPAHNEEHVIVRTLDGLAPLAASGTVDIVVVCNGCTDDTAAVARRYPGVTVIETDIPSKPAAMNLGDRTATRWPRLYLDGDIGIDASAVAAVFAELSREDGPLASRPQSVVDASDSTFLVRAYYRARARIPETGTRLWGAGGYAVSKLGHERFSAFPDVTADDSFVDGLFTESEKTVVPSVPMVVRAPRTSTALLGVLTRHRRGHVELKGQSETRSRVLGLIAGVRSLPSAVDAFAYAGLTAVARLRSRRRVGLGTSAWESDRSTRIAGSPVRADR